MSKAYQFPQDQPNPFADPAASAPAPPSDNPYLTSNAQAAEATVVRPTYQQTLKPRSGALTWWSVTALLLSILSLALAYFYLPLGLLSLFISVPTWLVARGDLKAMESGAMDIASRGQLQLAHRLAIGANVLGALSLLAIVGLAVLAVFSA